MSVTVIQGTVEQVAAKFEAVKKVIQSRKVQGYPLWNEAERWQYITARDGRVCPVCDGYDGRIFNGNEVQSFFPAVAYLGNYEAYPRTHDTPSFPAWIKRRADAPHGCGCKLLLTNPAEAFEAQLHRDKEKVI